MPVFAASSRAETPLDAIATRRRTAIESLISIIPPIENRSNKTSCA
nr:MAG TPA: hypothetical protein [Caudoviricetes sp.]